MTTPEPSSAPAMPALSPIDIIAEEAGAILGRVEREARLQGTALAADMRALTSDLPRREVELDLRMARLEQAAAERLAGLRDGRDGEPGPPGASTSGRQDRRARPSRDRRARYPSRRPRPSSASSGRLRCWPADRRDGRALAGRGQHRRAQPSARQSPCGAMLTATPSPM